MLPVVLLLAQVSLPGVKPLGPMEDPARAMVDGLHAYLEDRHAMAATQRAVATPTAERLREILGLPEESRTEKLPSTVQGARFRIAVERGFDATGTLQGPDVDAQCYAVHLGIRQFTTPDCLTFHLTLLDRATEYSGNPAIGKVTGQSHREFIYRMGYPMGMHPLALDVRKILAIIDYFKTLPAKQIRLVAAQDEDAMLTGLLACAVDDRIENCRFIGTD
ncbi:MAG: hypothetical protein K2Q23_14695, partial [Bryobacteraceae bacterium]|nr:hypothetical protein [Bryobacteraceae bacterium]